MTHNGSNTDFEEQYQAAEKFVHWLHSQILSEAKGKSIDVGFSGNPNGRFWLGRLGPKDFVTRNDKHGDRLEPCAIGLRLRPAHPGPWTFNVGGRFCIWRRKKAPKETHRTWEYSKIDHIDFQLEIEVGMEINQTFGKAMFRKAFDGMKANNLDAEIRVRVCNTEKAAYSLEISLVNTSAIEDEEFADSRFFESELIVSNLACIPFKLESLPDSFRYNRNVQGYGINCGVTVDTTLNAYKTNDGPSTNRARPDFYSSFPDKTCLAFNEIAQSPQTHARALCDTLDSWGKTVWSTDSLNDRAIIESWSKEMWEEAMVARAEFNTELARIEKGCSLLEHNATVAASFSLMNRAMVKSVQNKNATWRPFQFAFLLANLNCLTERESENDIVDIVWFSTGGGKTETYLGLIITAVYFDRIDGKISGTTAWSRFPLRMLSLQQTQRFANALAAAELIRLEEKLGGDPISLGFLVGDTATPNRILKDKNKSADGTLYGSTADDLAVAVNPYKLLEICPFCRQNSIETAFDREHWRLSHLCNNKSCLSNGEPLPIYVVDDEIWRFLPTVVIGTLDKAANISRTNGMRGLFGPPKGICTIPGHGYTYVATKGRPNGCLVPDCLGNQPASLPMEPSRFGLNLRLQDELHLLRDSLGAVDSHYESLMDGIQSELSGYKPKILASSATLSGYQKQVDVLYRREARVFPTQPPEDGHGFWSADSSKLMRKYVALAPQGLTVEFVIDRLIITLQKAIRNLLNCPEKFCNDLNIDPIHVPFLLSCYGTNVVYGNTLQDIDAIVRSSETQYTELKPKPNMATLTGNTDFKEVKEVLARLEHPESNFEDRIHIVTASSMMSHGVDIDRLNVMVMLALPLGVAEFIQATARVGRRWPALIIVVPKMARERDASVYRLFPEFVSHGDRFVEPIPITRKSRMVLERTLPGLLFARMKMIHEPSAPESILLIKAFNKFLSSNPDLLGDDENAIATCLGITDDDEFIKNQLTGWFKEFRRRLVEPPGDPKWVSELSPTGPAMNSLRDVEERVFIKGNEAAK